MKNFFKIFELRLLCCFFLLVSILYSVIAVQSHNHFQTFGWDLGFFDQLIWKISQGIFPYSSLAKVNLLADHFSPILFMLAPLYWLWSDVRILLIFQSLVMVFASLPLYLLSKYYLKSSFFSFAMVISYLFFLGTQWSILNEFHQATLTPLFIALTFFGLVVKNKTSWFWLGIVGLLLTKEEFALLSAALGLSVWIYFRKKFLGIMLTVFSIGLFFFLTNVFMPAISESGQYHHAHLSDSAKTPSELISKVIRDPIFGIKSLVTPVEKLTTLFWSLFAFGFLPLLAPWGILIPLVEQFGMRFLYTGPQFTVWQNVNHHAAPAAILMAIASIYGINKLGIRLGNKHKQLVFTLGGVVLLSTTLIQDVLFHGPVHSIFKPQLYQTQSWMKDNYQIIDSVPDDALVAAQNSLLSHLSQRKEFYLLPEIGDAEYIVVDLHDGPNKYAPLNHEQMTKFISGLISEKKFKIIKQANQAILLEKIN